MGLPARHLLVCFALCVIALVAYSNSFSTGFAMDSRALLLDDPRIREATPQNVGLILQHTYWWPTGEAGLYRPFTTLSYLFNYAILGNHDRSAGYHWINFLLHLGNVLLVYLLTLRLIGSRVPGSRFEVRSAGWAEVGNLAASTSNLAPAFIAGLWAVHPVLTESVTNIVGRADLLAASATLGGFLMYLKSTAATGWRRMAWLAGLMAVTTAGVFSKESAVTVLGVLVLYELTWWKERKKAQALLLGCLAILIPCGAMVYQRFLVLSASPPARFPFTDNPLVGAGFWTARLTAVKVMARYLWLMVWPARLSSDYSYPQIGLVTGSLQDWVAWLVVALAAAGAAFMYWKNRLVFFLAGLAFVTFVPASNLLFPIGTIMAERFLYLPAVGLVACVVLGAFTLSRRTGIAAMAPLVLCLVAAAFSLRTWIRNSDWQDDLTLATATVQMSPRSFKAHGMLANALYRSDRTHSNIDRVTAEAEKQLALLDSLPDASNNSEAYRTAGTYYLDKGDALLKRGPDGSVAVPPESARAYQKALPILLRCVAILKAQQEADLARARARGHPAPDFGAAANYAYRLLSVVYLRLGDTQDAWKTGIIARRLDPSNPEMYRNLAYVHLAADRGDEAAAVLMSGLIITADQGLRQELLNLYQRGLDPKGCAIIGGPNGPGIDPSCQTVHRHLCAGAADAIKLHLESGRRDLAERVKDNFLKSGCPAGPLDAALASAPGR
jgi:tetratricopeptide (TPR) repeat protein